MRQVRTFFLRIGGLFGKARHDGELADELESNLQFHIADNIRTGMSREEARRQALIQLGGIEQTKEDVRDQRGLPRIETFLHDTRYALRMLRKNPVFTFVAIATLALGIGATTAIFSVVNSVLLRPLAYPGSDRLYVIKEVIPQWASSAPLLDANLPDFLIWRQQTRSFEDIALTEGGSMILSGAGDPERVRLTRASANFLGMLGVTPALGRSFRPEEDTTGQGNVVILSDFIWRSRFHGDPFIIGRAIALDGAPYTVVGVLPASFHMPGALNGLSERAQMYIPLNGAKPFETDLIGEFDFTAIGRLNAGVTPAQATAELNTIQAAIAREARANVDLRAAIFPLQAEIVGASRRGLFLLLGAVGGVLLMICINLANLLLARVPGRLHDAGVRKALGATRARLFRQTLAESLLLSAMAGSLGLLLAHYAVQGFAHFGPADVPRLASVHIDLRALAFAFAAVAVTAILIGAMPAWLVSKADLNQTLGSSGRSTTESRSAHDVRGLLIAVEVATCTILLVVAGLLGRSLFNLFSLDPGFRTQHVLAADIDLPPVAYRDAAVRERFYHDTLAGIRSLPGVRSSAWITILPLQGQGSVSGINLPGRTLGPKDEPIVNYRVISPDYFSTMGIPIVQGRGFNDQDRGIRRVIVSQALAKRLWPGRDPVGEECIGEWGPLQEKNSEVVGVAGDVRTRLDQPPLDIVYVPDSWALTPPSVPMSASIVVQTVQDPSSVADEVRAVLRSAGPDVPIVALRPLSELVANNLQGRRFQTSLTASFAISALLLAGLGIFGVVAYSVEQRRREFGIRAALGATRPQLLTMVLRQGLRPVVFGMIAGIVGAVLAGSVVRGLVFGVAAFDPLTVTVVIVTIGVVGALSCYAPARRATRVEPGTALRYE
jgi:predicted permease